MFEETRKLDKISDINDVDVVTGEHKVTEYADAVHIDDENELDIVGEIDESVHKETEQYADEYDDDDYDDYDYDDEGEVESNIPSEPKSVEALFAELSQMITEAKSAFLSSTKCVINRDQAADLIDQITAMMPGELKDARIIIKARNELVHQARREAEETIKSAQAKADALSTSSNREAENTITSAKQKADATIATANMDANGIRASAQAEAATIVAKAKEDAQAMVEKEAVYKDAQKQANELLEDAKKKAQGMLSAANHKAKTMIDTTKKQCDELTAKTNAHVEELKLVSNNYMEESLRKTEEVIEASLRDVQSTRTKFKALTGAKPAAPEKKAPQKSFFMDID